MTKDEFLALTAHLPGDTVILMPSSAPDGDWVLEPVRTVKRLDDSGWGGNMIAQARRRLADRNGAVVVIDSDTSD